MFDKISYWLAYNRKKSLLAASVLLTIMILCSRSPSVDSTLAGYNIDNNPYDTVAARMMTFFGSNDLIQIIVHPENRSTTDLFRGLRDFENRLQKTFPGIRVESITGASRLLLPNTGEDRQVKETLTKALDIPVVRNLVSRDTSLFIIAAFSDFTYNFTTHRFDSVLALKYTGIGNMYAISPTHIQDEIEQSIIRDYLVILPVIMLFIMCFIFISYRNVKAVLFCMLYLVLSFVPVIFFLSLFGVTINQVTASAIPIAAILSLSASIHLLTGYLARSAETDKSARVYQTFRHYLIPSMLSAITTAVAFGSFLLNDSHYMRQFGIVAASSIIVVFILTYLISPCALRFVTGGNHNSSGLLLTRKLERFLISNRKQISIMLLVAALISVFLIPRIKFRTDLETYIPKKSDAQIAANLIRDYFHSISDLDILVEPDNRYDADTIGNIKGILMKAVSELSEKVSSYPEVVLVESIRDQMDYERHNMILGIPTVKFTRYGNPYVSEDRKKFRINVKLNNQNESIPVIRRFESEFQKYEGILGCSFYSDFLFFDYISSSVTRSLLKSLLFSALLITLILHILSGKFRITLICIVSNFVPLGFLIIIFAVFGIDMNISTSITLVICMGLIVDDTIHILFRRTRLGIPLGELGFSVLTTSLILTGGFLTFLLSRSGPNQVFGLLCSITFLIAAIADMSIIPWLLKVK